MNRLEKLSARRIDATVTHAKQLNEVYRTLQQSESVRYVVGAMQPIDPEYTHNTYAEGDRVRNQLDNRLTTTCTFEYQGSVTNDTHIKAKSDIDLLVIIEKFWRLEPPLQPTVPYLGNSLQDLIDLRIEVEKVLPKAFPEVVVDTSGSKSVVLSGGSLRRKIDVVPSNWLNTTEYARTGDQTYRAIEILDTTKKERLKNTPFLHNKMIEEKDRRTNGGLRKAARLLKSLKYDSEKVHLSSYDLVSIAWTMSEVALYGTKGTELALLNACRDYCSALESSSSLRDSLFVPDGHRKIFTAGHATVEGLRALLIELNTLVIDVLTENARSFQKLGEARIAY